MSDGVHLYINLKSCINIIYGLAIRDSKRYLAEEKKSEKLVKGMTCQIATSLAAAASATASPEACCSYKGVIPTASNSGP